MYLLDRRIDNEIMVVKDKNTFQPFLLTQVYLLTENKYYSNTHKQPHAATGSPIDTTSFLS